jgi:hypothetical protein
LSLRAPGDDGGLPRPPWLHHNGIVWLEHKSLACVEHMIFGVATPREPDAPTDNGELARPVIDAQRLAPLHGGGSYSAGIQLRVHHQSPDLRQRVLLRRSLYDRSPGGLNPMKSICCFDADLI